MEHICWKHDEISKLANKRWYRWNIDSKDIEELKDIIWDMEHAFSNISDIVDEAKVMWQRMEDGLKRRKEAMEEAEIEKQYQLTK